MGAPLNREAPSKRELGGGVVTRALRFSCDEYAAYAPPARSEFSRDDERDIAWYHLESAGACGLRCPLGNATGMAPMREPSEQDGGLITGMRMAWVEHALRGCTPLDRKVLQARCAPESFLKSDYRAQIRPVGPFAAVMLLTFALWEWADVHDHERSLIEALVGLDTRKRTGSRAQSEAACQVLTSVRREADSLVMGAGEAYARRRQADPDLERQRRAWLDHSRARR